jgi:glycosyltransferase involved in cell wall biosynthesis
VSERVSVLIGAYNEEWRLPPVLREVQRYCGEDHPVDVDEVIIVSDGSRDRTVERAQYFIGRIPGLRFEIFVQNRGKWAALHRGMELAVNDWVLLLDADGSASISELGRLDTLPDCPVWGRRVDVGGKGPLRKMLSVGYRLFAGLCYRVVVGKRAWVSDMQAPWKLFRKSWVTRELVVERFAGDIERSEERRVGKEL